MHVRRAEPTATARGIFGEILPLKTVLSQVPLIDRVPVHFSVAEAMDV